MNHSIKQHRIQYRNSGDAKQFFNVISGEIREYNYSLNVTGWCVITDRFFPVFNRNGEYLGFVHDKHFEKVLQLELI